MAGRILLNTSGDAFRVKPQSRRHFDEQHDDGRMSGEDWMRNIGQAMDLGMKAYGVANVVAPLLSSGGQSVVPGAAQLAADKGADAVVAAQNAAMPQQMAAPPPPPMQMNPETHMPVGYSQHPEMAQAQAAMQQAQMYRPIESMQQSVTNPIISSMTAPQSGVFTQSSSVGVPQIQYSPFEGVSPNEIMGRMSMDGLPVAEEDTFMGREVGQMSAPPASQAVALTELPTETLRQLQVDFANDQERLKIVQDELRRRSSGVEGGGKQQSALQAFEAAEAAVPQEMAEFATLADAQSALAMASSTGDRQAWKAAVDNMANSPLSDVRPQNLQDAIFGTHAERAKRALIAKYPAPKAMTGMDALKAELMQARIGKFKTDDERNRAIHFLKEFKEFREGKKFELFKKRHAKEMIKLGIDIGISATELNHRAPKLLAQIKANRAKAWRDSAQAARTTQARKFEKTTEPIRKEILKNTEDAPRRKDAHDAEKRLHDKDMQKQREKSASLRGFAQGQGDAMFRTFLRAEAKLAGADEVLSDQPSQAQLNAMSESEAKTVRARIANAKKNKKAAQRVIDLIAAKKKKMKGGATPKSATPKGGTKPVVTSTRKPGDVLSDLEKVAAEVNN